MIGLVPLLVIDIDLQILKVNPPHQPLTKWQMQ